MADDSRQAEKESCKRDVIKKLMNYHPSVQTAVLDELTEEPANDHQVMAMADGGKAEHNA